MHHLDIFLTTEDKSFYAKLSKYEFGMTDILYISHLIGQEGVKVHMEKIKVILDWPILMNLTKLRGFISIFTYYRNFVKGFSKFTTPLTDLTKKGAFFWSKKVEQPLKLMKEVMSSFPVLALPDFTQPFVLECDASRDGIGVVLMQICILLLMREENYSHMKGTILYMTKICYPSCLFWLSLDNI